MGIFNKIFKSSCEGLIEAYLQTYKNVKNSPQFREAAELFSTDTKMPAEFHYINSTIQARKYGQIQLEGLMTYFMMDLKRHVEEAKVLTETQMILSMLKAAHKIESKGNTNYNFSAIATDYIGCFFERDELSNEIDIQTLEEAFRGLP